MNSFRDAVLSVVRTIPRGTTATYGEVAERAGNSRAARAVGYYMSQNFDPSVPCHRVIRSDGKIGNYNRGGVKKKLKLLKREGAL